LAQVGNALSHFPQDLSVVMDNQPAETPPGQQMSLANPVADNHWHSGRQTQQWVKIHVFITHSFVPIMAGMRVLHPAECLIRYDWQL
jgi:hypothetical protein